MAMSLISIHNYVDTILTWYVQSITEKPPCDTYSAITLSKVDKNSICSFIILIKKHYRVILAIYMEQANG